MGYFALCIAGTTSTDVLNPCVIMPVLAGRELGLEHEVEDFDL